MFFKDEISARFFLLVSGIHIKTRRILENRLKEVELTFPQFGVLLALAHKDRINQKELSEILETDTTNIMVICDSLEKKGIVQRISNPVDRRSNLIVLTEKGRKMNRKTQPMIEKYNDHIMKYTSPEEISSTFPLLQKIYGEIKKIEQSLKNK